MALRAHRARIEALFAERLNALENSSDAEKRRAVLVAERDCLLLEVEIAGLRAKKAARERDERLRERRRVNALWNMRRLRDRRALEAFHAELVAQCRVCRGVHEFTLEEVEWCRRGHPLMVPRFLRVPGILLPAVEKPVDPVDDKLLTTRRQEAKTMIDESSG